MLGSENPFDRIPDFAANACILRGQIQLRDRFWRGGCR
jgi:hypothetical protein